MGIIQPNAVLGSQTITCCRSFNGLGQKQNSSLNICDSQSVPKLNHLLFFYTTWKYLSATVEYKVPNTRFLGHKNQVKILTKYPENFENFWSFTIPLPDIHKMSDIFQNSQHFRVSLNIFKNSQNW